MRAVRPSSLAALFALAACATHPASAPPAQTVPATAPATGQVVTLVPNAPVGSFPFTTDTRQAFARACPALLRRADQSGLTRPEDWRSACEDPNRDPQAFFSRHFTAVRIGDGKGFTTGYFEPEIAGSRTPKPGSAPVYGKPHDLVEVDLTPFAADLKGRRIRGRWTGRSVVPYFSRAEIENGALAGRKLELAWADDPVELFFLEIQGSGRLRLPDGEVLRIGYAGQNGHPYVAIGRLLRQRGMFEKPGMEEIIGWIRQNPAAGKALMRENPSAVFFQLADPGLDGPLGTLGVPLIAEANAAVDPARLPLGAPILARFEMNGAPTERMLIAADTGGAIRGDNRIDIFWGAGPKARAAAASLATTIDLLVLLPHAAAERQRQNPPR